MKNEILVVLSVLIVGCAEKPAPQTPESRETAARAEIATGHAKPVAPAPAKDTEFLKWRGLDLSKAPVSTDVSKLPDLWEARPAGSRSFEVRNDVIVIRPPEDTTGTSVYWVPSKDRFYVQRDPFGSSSMHFYGPFEGNPLGVVNLPPTTDPAGR